MPHPALRSPIALAGTALVVAGLVVGFVYPGPFGLQLGRQRVVSTTRHHGAGAGGSTSTTPVQHSRTPAGSVSPTTPARTGRTTPGPGNTNPFPGNPTSPSVPPTSSPYPPPGVTVLYSDDFSTDALGSVPAGWHALTGQWQVVASAIASTSVHRLQSAPGAANLATAGNTAWSDYYLTATLIPDQYGPPFSFALAARVQDARDMYLCSLGYKGITLSVLDGGAGRTLATAPFASRVHTLYTMVFELHGSSLSCSVRFGATVTARDGTFGAGAIGFSTIGQGQFGSVQVSG